MSLEQTHVITLGRLCREKENLLTKTQDPDLRARLELEIDSLSRAMALAGR